MSLDLIRQGLTSLAWHYEGRQFMCSHCDGALSVWNLRTTDKPASINYPHSNPRRLQLIANTKTFSSVSARIAKDETTKFAPINKVIWSAMKST